MFKTKGKKLVLAIALLAGIFTYYRFAAITFEPYKNEEEVLPSTSRESIAKEVSALSRYMTPKEVEDVVKFIVSVDARGSIVEVRAEVLENANVKKTQEFARELSVIIKGKKLSELTAIDKVGTSSLTTEAFNEILDDLKSQL